MKILTTSTTQSIKFIPRKYVSDVNLHLINKDTKAVTEFIPVVSNSDSYMTLSVDGLNLKEGTTYSMLVYSDEIGTIYQDMVFCTNQTDYIKYNIQEGEYVSPEATDNEYVVL